MNKRPMPQENHLGKLPLHALRSVSAPSFAGNGLAITGVSVGPGRRVDADVAILEVFSPTFRRARRGRALRLFRFHNLPRCEWLPNELARDLVNIAPGPVLARFN
jgi:hypothetical protein